MNTVENFLTPEELADRLQVTRSWVCRHAQELGAYHLGKYIRFSWPKVLAAVERLPGLGSENFLP